MAFSKITSRKRMISKMKKRREIYKKNGRNDDEFRHLESRIERKQKELKDLGY